MESTAPAVTVVTRCEKQIVVHSTLLVYPASMLPTRFNRSNFAANIRPCFQYCTSEVRTPSCVGTIGARNLRPAKVCCNFFAHRSRTALVSNPRLPSLREKPETLEIAAGQSRGVQGRGCPVPNLHRRRCKRCRHQGPAVRGEHDAARRAGELHPPDRPRGAAGLPRAGRVHRGVRRLEGEGVFVVVVVVVVVLVVVVLVVPVVVS